MSRTRGGGSTKVARTAETRDHNRFTSSTDGVVGVNKRACMELAELLKEGDVPPDEEEREFPGLSPQELGNFFLALVAICHQTSPRGCAPLEGVVNHVRLRGWDYLLARFEGAVTSNPSLLQPSFWATLRASDVRGLFRDAECGDRLTDPGGRAALLRDLGQRTLARGWCWAEDLYSFCDRRIAVGEPNLLGELSRFEAYRDPVRKKSLFFLSLMRNSRCWRYVDDENLGPPVDYHEVRGHLRLGTIEVRSAALEEKLRCDRDVEPEEDIAIRRAVYHAIMLVSDHSGHSPSVLHYLFWNIFRSVCTRLRPHCLTIREDCELSRRYVPLTHHADGQCRCPFSSQCPSARRADRYVEHRIKTDFY